MPKWGSGKAVPIVRVGAKKAAVAKVVAKATGKALEDVASDMGLSAGATRVVGGVPSGVLETLTSPCGVLYYNNRREQASEYRPFYSEKLASLQGDLTTARTKMMGMVGTLEDQYNEINGLVGSNLTTAYNYVQMLQTGIPAYYGIAPSMKKNLKVAHNFLYGRSDTFSEHMADFLNFISGDFRSDIQEALSEFSAAYPHINAALNEIEAVKNTASASINCINTNLSAVETWSGNALKMAKGFCAETDGMAYMNRREQRFDMSRTGWRDWNEPCDKYRRPLISGEPGYPGYTHQIWPKSYDEAWEGSIRSKLGVRWPAAPWKKGCILKGRGYEHAHYDCGSVPIQGVRGCINLITNEIPNDVERLLAYDPTTLFYHTQSSLTAAKDAIEKIIPLLQLAKSILISIEVTTALHVAEYAVRAACEIDCWYSYEGSRWHRCVNRCRRNSVRDTFGVRDEAVRGVSDAIEQLEEAQVQIGSALAGIPTARTMWNSSPPPLWRDQVNSYIDQLRALNGPLQAPWTSPTARAACGVVFPRVPDACLESMIPTSCGAPTISTGPGKRVIEGDMRRFDDWGKKDAGSDMLEPDKPVFETEEAFGSIVNTPSQEGLKTWQKVALVGGLVWIISRS